MAAASCFSSSDTSSLSWQLAKRRDRIVSRRLHLYVSVVTAPNRNDQPTQEIQNGEGGTQMPQCRFRPLGRLIFISYQDLGPGQY